MQWNGSPGAGFSTAEPWLPIVEPGAVNVEAQREDERSMLSTVRRMIHLRRTRNSLNSGRFEIVDASEDVLSYRRTSGEQESFVALNFSEKETSVMPPGGRSGEAVILCSTYMDIMNPPAGEEIPLRPGEGVMVSL